MHFDDREAVLLKKWTVKKLEVISDADSEVLADYVLALIRNDDPDQVAKSNCIENLRDFLPDNVESFVNDVFTAIATKAYDPSRPTLKPTIPSYVPPKRGSLGPPRQSNESRKRSYHDWDRDERQSARVMALDGGDRPMKQAKRGGRGTSGQRAGRLMTASTQPYLPFNPNDPLAFMIAMQQAAGLLPGFVSGGPATSLSGSIQQRSTQRCKDYDEKGFCARGANCPFKHGDDPYIVPYTMDEYDPQATALFDLPTFQAPQSNPFQNGRGSGRGRGRGVPGHRGRGQRAPFSHIGQIHDNSVTSIVVEQIPEDCFDEQVVRDFFRNFGTIEEVTMQPYKHLAIIKFDSHDAAKAAYDSPKAIFDNRFVKVFWYKPEDVPSDGHSAGRKSHRIIQNARVEEVDDDFDADVFSRQQEEAQRSYEEACRKREEVEQRKKELDDQLSTMEAERKRLVALLAKKTGEPAPPEAHESEQTKALKAQLAKLEAEAKSLGIDPEDAVQGCGGPPPSYRGRGGYRGRGRGRGLYTNYGGGWAGPERRPGAVLRLDNRPKTVCVAFEGGHYDDYDEALRQYLMLSSMDTAALSKHPGRDNAALIAFLHRYEAEIFIATGSDLPHIGKVDLSWYVPGEKTLTVSHDDNSSDIDIKISDAPVSMRQNDGHLKDMDTYDEEIDDVE